MKIYEKDLNSWEEFKERVEEIQEETQRLKANPNKVGAVSEPLYRGQSNHEWHLESTLERKHRQMTLGKYFAILEKIKSKVEKNSGKSWPNFAGVNDRKLRSIYHITIDLPIDATAYMTFLRHHGFPSPFLDWTACPYVASYFAFEGIDTNTKRIAIYFFRKDTGLPTDCKKMSEPTVDQIGHNIENTSGRHRKQKTHYTICLENPTAGESLQDYIIANIEEDINNVGFPITGEDYEGDNSIPEAGNVVRKYTIPATEKNKVLKELEAQKINRESLFESTQDNILIDLWYKYGM